MKTFIDRLQAAIQADQTISAYNADRVIVVTEDDLSRHDGAAFAIETGTLFVIHDLLQHESHPEHEELGRDCSKFTATITAVQKAAGGIDETGMQETGITGDGNLPGIVKMQTDLWTLLWKNGFLNLFPDAAGENYLWDLEIGEAGERSAIQDEESLFITSSRQIVGHRWQFYW